MSVGLERVKSKLRTHAAAALAAAKQQAQKEAETVAQLMRAMAPEDEHNLIKSIRTEPADTFTTKSGQEVKFIGVMVRAGDETTIVTNKSGGRFQNAKLQEHGTQKMKANPYFNPAKRLRRRAAKANITRAVRKAWKDGG